MEVSIKGNEAIFQGQPWKQISPPDQGMKVFVPKSEHSNYNRLKNKAKTDYHAGYLLSQLNSLNNRHGLLRSSVSRFKPTEHKLEIDGGYISYSMANGCVFIQDYDVVRSRSKDKAGLYQVAFKGSSKGVWEAKETSRIHSDHIAVNGGFADILSATSQMPAFIERGYKPETTKATLENSDFTIFYNDIGTGIGSDFREVFDASIVNTKGGSENAKKLAQIIRIEARAGKELNWTLHEKGHALFKRALQIALKELSPKEIENLGKQKVFYANPTMNLSVIDHYRKKAGMQLAPQRPLMNELNLSQTWGTGNAISEIHVSARQMKEQGENGLRNLTPGQLTATGFKRTMMAAVGASPYLIPEAALSVQAVSFATGWAALVMSNFGANSKVIENGGDMIDHAIQKLRHRA
ncbi:hypothetical protein [Thalassolituus sp.]|uniref:hypothetical protein n=1 Tax=Thalassolituus sp. TaxID=2030822 RepID=UPI0026246864|nr:hypothetical protein [Thalassolituus sp.]